MNPVINPVSIEPNSHTENGFANTPECAAAEDAKDSLRDFRSRFYIPKLKGNEVIYFTGNSLGLQPKTAAAYIQQELNDWAELGVEGHFRGKNPWVSYHECLAEPLAQLVGAQKEEVVAMNSLTANLHHLMATFYRPTKNRFKIICEAKAFPSDQYALESQVILHGFDPEEAIIKIAPRNNEYHIRLEDIESGIKEAGDSLALVLFGGVNYYSGQVLDMKSITAAAHRVGAYAGFDLAHAIGNIELQLSAWDVDFACWCTYKYLNSGPGSVAGIYINCKHAANTKLPRLAGWWGTNKETRFQMKPQFEPIPTAEGWQLSNAPVLCMAAHKASLDLFAEAGMPNLVKKSRRLTAYLFYVLEAINKEYKTESLQVITPRDAFGCQVSILMLQKGREVFDSLSEAGVVADWREPNVIRVAPVPLYNSFTDVWRFGSIIKSVLNKTGSNG